MRLLSSGQRTNLTTSGTAYTAGQAPAYNWGYNAQGELITANDTSAANNDRTYQYDAIGNRLKSANSLTLPGTNNYQSNGLNQYTSINTGAATLSPSYDLDGNATSYPLPVNQGSAAALIWDAENRLTSVTVNGTTTNYQYDAQSRPLLNQGLTDLSGAIVTADALNVGFLASKCSIASKCSPL